jgi:hypothetical protein
VLAKSFGSYRKSLPAMKGGAGLAVKTPAAYQTVAGESEALRDTDAETFG